MKIRFALLSVFDKTGLVELARQLRAFGVEILATGGTARVLREAGVEALDLSEYTGSPDLMGGRLKSLHFQIHGGLLAVRDNEEHMAQVAKLGLRPIDLVVVNLSPFPEGTPRTEASLEEAVEAIDVGGVALVRSAAKNHRYVTVVTDPADYGRVAEELQRRGGAVSEMLRRELAIKAFAYTARYDASIAAFLGGRGVLFPDVLALRFEKLADLRYGENPHQKAAAYRAPVRTGPSVAHAAFLGGKELSYNNLLDLDSAFEAVKDLRTAGCVIVKHNNPCGAGCAESAAAAFRKALEGDPVSAFGGLVAFNVPVDPEAAEAIARKELFFEGIIAPRYGPGTVEILRERTRWGKTLRILEAGEIPASGSPLMFRSIRDGLLAQTFDDGLAAEIRAVHGNPSEDQKRDLMFAWAVAKHVRSNAILIARDEMVVGVGAGQMSRVDSSYIAVRKAGDRARGAVAASDAFFPFPDALEVLLDAGVTAIIQPGGSVRDEEVLETARRRGIPVLLTGMRHFKH